MQILFHGNKGYILLDAIIGLLIAAIALSALFGSLRTITTTTASVLRQAEENQNSLNTIAEYALGIHDSL